MSITDLKEQFRSLMTLKVTGNSSVTDVLDHVGLLIDVSADLDRSEGTRRGIELAQQCLDLRPSPAESTLLHYFLANAWSHLRRSTRQGSDSVWDWEQSEIEQELVHLRQARSNEGFRSLPDIRQCQISTNLGNLLSHVGRFVEAIEYWDRALSVEPAFSMALVNRGQGLATYARALYDEGHQKVFLRQAHIDFTAGLKSGVESHAVEWIEQYKVTIEEFLPAEYLKSGTALEGFPLGDSDDERSYRRWCLENRLYLNPLNDLGPFSIAAHDIFTVPSIVVSVSEGPIYHGFFNQLKQEYVSARYFYYEASLADEAHFADKEVLLYNTFDYPAYSLHVERMKAAFRMAYSLLDKTAFFLNDYLKLGISERQVTFKTIWYDTKKRNRGLKTQFQGYENWPLRGLFWVSKDLFEDSAGFREPIEPDAQEPNTIRNHIEHKYLKLHDMWSPELAASRAEVGTGDRLAFSLERHDFETKTLRLLKIARAVLIYLSLGIHCEEQHRQSARGDDFLSVPGLLDTWNDEWKL